MLEALASGVPALTSRGSSLGEIARDAQGFDAGSEAAGTRWSCVRDHVTGLDWEVRTHTPVPALRDRGWTYSWYSSAQRPDGTANASNGGEAGGSNRGECFDRYDADSNPGGLFCDSAGYVEAVNAIGLCGSSDWRMPTRRELESIVHYGTRWPAIDRPTMRSRTSGLKSTSGSSSRPVPSCSLTTRPSSMISL